MTYVIAVRDDRFLALLQSRIHRAWVRLTASTLEDRQGYRPTDCFETFPFPDPTAFVSLDSVGARLDAERRAYVDREKVGLTTTYNRLKDDSVTDETVVALRQTHEDLDRAVLDAYGWKQIAVPPYCGATAKQLETFEDEVLDELFKLNAERAKAEALLAVANKPKGRSKSKAPSPA